MQARWRYGVAGVVAGFAGLCASLAAAWLMHAATNPVVAVASVVRDRTPGHLAVKLVHLVGHADKPLLITGTVVILLLLSWLSGTLGRAAEIRGMVLILVLGAAGVVAVLTQHRTDVQSALAAVFGLLVWLFAYRGLMRPASIATEEDTGRRRFLVTSAGVVVGAGLVAAGARWSGHGRRAVEQARAKLKLPIKRGSEPAGVSLGVDGIEPWRTPDARFYRVDTAFTPPAVSPHDWSLRIHGMVDHELRISYDDLIARQFTSDWITLCCVSNEVGGSLIGNAYWSGVPIRSILAEAGVHPDADAVEQTSYDGWTCGTPLAALTDPHRNAMLAVGMNGEPLPLAHGFPVRMVVPGLYGYVSATKWLVDIEVTRFDRFEAYWTRGGWSEKGPVKTQSKIEVPRGGARVSAGTVPVGGVAWAQHTGIARVEFQVDGGPWQPARLGGVPGNDTWVQWAGSVSVDAGKHELRVRATDKSGYTQTAVRQGVIPNGATGWHSVSFTAA
ncbi:MAG TPA: molybdopterin-dependent oxidoreductase [Marmoricola sp.]